MTAERQVPFFCPYCGEESLRPSGPDAGEWACGACARAFQLRFAGVQRPAGAAAQPASSTAQPANSTARPAASTAQPGTRS